MVFVMLLSAAAERGTIVLLVTASENLVAEEMSVDAQPFMWSVFVGFKPKTVSQCW